ncbi:polysaccharide pyruvyl transferase family protein [Lentisphaerota bacterium WC36G]|nr:polysaccharide pyruvyl transferase family protein [Lentisphaerae bacterium WC36]
MNFINFHYIYPVANDKISLGDYIQSVALKGALKKTFKDEKLNFIDFNRDSLRYYKGEKAICVMQGWFSLEYDWLPSENLTPVYVGTHFNRTIDHYLHNKEVILALKESTPLGCRGTYTRDKLAKLGLKTYLSRCLSLTLDKRELQPINKQVYIVDVREKYQKYIPKKIRKRARILSQKNYAQNYGSHLHHKYFEGEAEKLLEEYRQNATLVITGAMHCALPCLAMGIPVIFLDLKTHKKDFKHRFSAASDLLKCYDEKDLKKKRVDWNPEEINIEDLKDLLLQNLEYSVKTAINEKCDYDIDSIREQISKYKVARD